MVSPSLTTEVKKYSGLTSTEAAKRLLRYGPNIASQKRHLLPLVAFIKKFNSPILFLLIGAAIVAFITGSRVSASVILVMVFASGILDFINTYHSEKVVQKLLSHITTHVTIIRDGQKIDVPLKNVVPGDLAVLSAGDIIPADGVLLEADDLFVSQSALTGESFPAEKNIASSFDKVSDKNKFSSPSLVFLGTSVISGYATMEARATGAKTEFGKIASRLAETEPKTEFEKGIKSFSVFLMRLTLAMVTVVFIVNALMGRGWLTSFIFAVAIAVGLTPELLPVIMTVALSRGSMRMAKSGVIVKHLTAIQNLGEMDTLCTDKTGTLTEDKIKLVQCVNIDGKESKDVFRYAYLSSSFHTEKRSPLDTAILEHGRITVKDYKKVDEIPFDFLRRRNSIVVDVGSNRLLLIKGAPENILDISKTYLAGKKTLTLTASARKRANEEFNRLSADGFRVLSVGIKKLPQDKKTRYEKEIEAGITFAGFAAFLDPPKKDVLATIQELEKLGIVMKIITGDHEILTERICRDIALPIQGLATGAEVEKSTDEELKKLVTEHNIFARITPLQKERIILALRAGGHVVGYMGDGINDAAALKAADVGISVNNAVDVAKEEADIILLTKSLHNIRAGVEEGRKTFQNTLKYLKMVLSSNFGNMFSMMGSSVFLPFLPMLPPQILLNNFLYDFSQTTLPSDNVDAEDIQKPLRWDVKYLQKYMAVFGLASSVYDFMTFFVLLIVFHLPAAQFQAGWFIESMATQVFVVYFIRTRRMPFKESAPSWLLVMSTLFVVGVACAIALSAFGFLFGFSTIPISVLATIAAITFAYLITVFFLNRKFYHAKLVSN